MKLGLEDIVSLIVSNINAFGVEKISAALESKPEGYGIKFHSENGRIASNVLEGVAIDELSFSVSGVKLGLSPAQLMEQAAIKVDRIAIRMSADLLNSFLSSPTVKEELRRNAPVEINGLRFVFVNEKVTIRGEVRKFVTVPFTVELDFKATEEGFKVVFANFWAADMVPLPQMIRNLIMSFAKQKLSSIKELEGIAEITDDYVVINPWPKVPLKNLSAKFSSFGVKNSYFVVELGPDNKEKPAPEKQAAAEIAAEPEVKAAPVEKNRDGSMVMPLPPM